MTVRIPKLSCQKFENILGSFEETTHRAGEGWMEIEEMGGRKNLVCRMVWENFLRETRVEFLDSIFGEERKDQIPSSSRFPEKGETRWVRLRRGRSCETQVQ